MRSHNLWSDTEIHLSFAGLCEALLKPGSCFSLLNITTLNDKIVDIMIINIGRKIIADT